MKYDTSDFIIGNAFQKLSSHPESRSGAQDVKISLWCEVLAQNTPHIYVYSMLKLSLLFLRWAKKAPFVCVSL